MMCAEVGAEDEDDDEEDEEEGFVRLVSFDCTTSTMDQIFGRVLGAGGGNGLLGCSFSSSRLRFNELLVEC